MTKLALIAVICLVAYSGYKLLPKVKETLLKLKSIVEEKLGR